MRNIFHIEADYKLTKQVVEPVVTQNDSVVFHIAVLDNGLPYDLSEMAQATLAHKRPDGQVVITPGTLFGENVVTFELGGSEFAVTGRVEATVQLYGVDGRASTLQLSYRVIDDPVGSGYIPSEKEKTLIEIVLVEGPLVIAEAKEAGADARRAASEADAAALRANTAAGAAETATEAANLATQGANTAKEAADAATGAANTATEAANDAAGKANTAATGADTAAGQANTAAQAATEATTTVQLLINELRSARSYDPRTQYKKNNLVEHYGSTFIALKDTLGVAPPDLMVAIFNESWYLVAQRGVDGKGSVVTVNGKGPDASGNVVIDIPQPILDYSELQNIPTEFTPKAHKHPMNDVTGLDIALQQMSDLIASIGQTGIPHLVRYPFIIDNLTNAQATLTVPLESYDASTDTMLLVRNSTVLYEGADYTITGRTVNLTSPVVDATTTAFYMLILKNVPIGPAGAINAMVLADGTVTKAKLELSLQQVLDSVATKASAEALELIADTLGTTNTDLSQHINNQEIHVTQAKRDLWNTVANKASYVALGKDDSDPDTERTQFFVTSHAKMGGGYWYVENKYIWEDSPFANCMQIAVQYIGAPNIKVRHRYNGEWSPWSADFYSLLQSVNSKANKVQSSGFSATLLNGWTGDVNIYKDDMGRVHVFGTISGGKTASGTGIFTFPVGYRRTNGFDQNIVSRSGNAASLALTWIGTDGTLILITPSQATLDLNFSFKVP